jgi:hypothetical protein
MLKAGLALLVVAGACAWLFLLGSEGSIRPSKLSPELADPAAFVAAARSLVDATLKEHKSLDDAALPPALRDVPHVQVEIAADHVDFVTFKERDGRMGYRIWSGAPAADDALTKYPDVHYLRNDWGQPQGPGNHP